nr:DUF4157 domain-containing protein [Myxococcota bacterium]
AVARAGAGQGAALPDPLREKFEGSLGTDLSGVRVHTGAASHEAAGAVGAHAYALGNDIHFASGQYDPHSSGGQELIAHEVAHTVQQRGGAPARQHKLAISQPGDSFEREADVAASAMVRGEAASVSGGGVQIARTENTELVPGPKPSKADSTKASVAKQSVDVQLFGKSGKITCTEDGVNGSLDLKEIKLGETKRTISKKWPFQAPGAPGGIMVILDGSLTLSSTATVTATGGVRDFGGPRVDDKDTMGFSGSLEGGGGVSLTGEGKLTVVGYAGAPFANLNAGAYVKLTATAATKFGAKGTFEISPDGVAQGNLVGDYGADLTVTGSGGLTIGYQALIKEGTLYEVELASHDFVKGKLGLESKYDFATGAATSTDTSEEPRYIPIQWSTPRPKEALKAEDRAHAEREANDSEGGSGAGPGVAPESYEPPETAETAEGHEPGTCDDLTASCETEETK